MKISAVILTKNEEGRIEDCLESVKWADEVLIIDSGSSDGTIGIAQKYTDRIFLDRSDDFSAKRNLGLTKARSDWVFYVDADERVSSDLQAEISEAIKTNDPVAYFIPRKNFYFGNHQWPYIEKIERLFKREQLKGWKGELHESPIIQGLAGELKNHLLHYTHRDLSSMVEKTIKWSKIEAELRFQTNHPLVTWWRFPRVMLTEFYRSYFKQEGWRVGTVGIMESLYQAFSIFITYARLWEIQQQRMKTKGI